MSPRFVTMMKPKNSAVQANEGGLDVDSGLDPTLQNVHDPLNGEQDFMDGLANPDPESEG